jgi:hypothetical protein
VSRRAKLIEKILDRNKTNNVTFAELCECATEVGWQKKTRAGTSHVLYWHTECPDLLNLQPGPNGKAKPYQVKLVRNSIINLRARGKLTL